MPSSTDRPALPLTDYDPHWLRNLCVCVFGVFTTIVAMTLLLPFLPLYVEQLGSVTRRLSCCGRGDIRSGVFPPR